MSEGARKPALSAFLTATLVRSEHELDRQIALDEPSLEDRDGEVVLEVHPPLAASRMTAPLREPDPPRLVPPRLQGAVEPQLLEEDGSLRLRAVEVLPLALP